eukprot:scaffold548604_cov45-Prasinocladus_malaysianus.AAC.1
MRPATWPAGQADAGQGGRGAPRGPPAHRRRREPAGGVQIRRAEGADPRHTRPEGQLYLHVTPSNLN